MRYQATCFNIFIASVYCCGNVFFVGQKTINTFLGDLIRATMCRSG